jgi:hypothetical protein
MLKTLFPSLERIKEVGKCTHYFSDSTHLDTKTTRTLSDIGKASSPYRSSKSSLGGKVLSAVLSVSPVTKTKSWISQNRVLFFGSASALVALVITLLQVSC